MHRDNVNDTAPRPSTDLPAGRVCWSDTRRSGWATARDLRRTQTPAEELLWSRLRRNGLGAAFRRQHPIGPFVVDFLCSARGLVVELDGDIHERDEVREQDLWREEWLRGAGYRVVRFSNADVLDGIDAVLAAIRKEITEGG